MANFQAIDEFLQTWIELPIKGKLYRISSPDARTGLLVTRLMGLATDAANDVEIGEDQRVQLVLDDKEEKELTERVLGATLEEMLNDSVEWPMVQHVLQTAMVWISLGLPQAEKYWISVVPGKAPAPQDHLPKRATPKDQRA